MMVADRSRPAAPGNHWVIEINSSPGISDFYILGVASHKMSALGS